MIDILFNLIKKSIAAIVAIITMTVGVVQYIDKAKSEVKKEVIEKVAEWRQGDIKHINSKLDDLKDDMRIIKQALIERK
jgi:5-bromo-4-chloroindolyl phosphate hydrolysis protein